MKATGFIIFGLISSAIAVGMGALGSHAMEDLLQANNRIETYSTAVEYHIYHSLGLLIIAVLINLYQLRILKTSGFLMAGGILFFSGSLYLLSITDATYWAYFTPLGGLMFIVAWILPVFSFFRKMGKD